MPTLITFNGLSSKGVKIEYGTTAPLDTSGRTIWFNQQNNQLYFYSAGEWRALNTWQ